MSKKITISVEEYNALREVFDKASEIINRFGSSLDGLKRQNETVKKEPTQNQRVKNYSALIDSKTKYQKPKHLRK